MTDCPNAEMRDRLPDLLHERLDASIRAAVMAHVESCAECHAELALLREARVALSSGARPVDTAAIARAVVARVPVPSVSAARRRTRIDWRIAAAVAFIAVGGASFVALRAIRQPALVTPPAETAVASALPDVGAPPVGSTTHVIEQPPAHHASPTATVAQNAELSAAGGMSDLSDGDLKALLNDLEKMDAEPLIEPEPVNVRLSPGRGSSE
jgi:anti-sigma factor RsiW